jgi:hypothetical protein
LAQRQRLDGFFQRADAAGEDDEAVGLVEQGLFPLVHVVGVAVLDAVEHAFEIAQEVGHDAQHLTAGIARVGGDSAHQADIAAAIDSAPAAGFAMALPSGRRA